MRNLKKLAAISALAAGALAVSAVQAAPITGGISLSGGYRTDTGNVNTATAFTVFSNVQVNGATGSFAGVDLFTVNSISMSAFSFAPFPAGGVTPLWQTVSGSSAAFDFLTLTQMEQTGDNTLDIKGKGNLLSRWFRPDPLLLRVHGQPGGWHVLVLVEQRGDSGTRHARTARPRPRGSWPRAPATRCRVSDARNAEKRTPAPRRGFFYWACNLRQRVAAPEQLLSRANRQRERLLAA